MAEALEQANELGALALGDITLPASDALDSPLVNISWRPHSASNRPPFRSSNFWDDADDSEPRMLLAYEAQSNPGGGPGLPVVEVVWHPNESPVDVLHALRDEMRRKGFVGESKAIGDRLFMNLRTAIGDALAARTGSAGSWAHGAMYEWIADGWAVTDRGLVTRDHGTVESTDFPEAATQRLSRTGSNIGVKRFSKPAPAGVAEDLWAHAVTRASRHHPRGGWIGLGAPETAAYTPTTSPRTKPGWPHA